jgi:hypothetical protein
MLENEDIESRLRTFRPRRPAPLLEHYVLRRSRAPFLIAAAAVIAVAVLVVSWIERRRVAPAVDSATLGSLTALALDDPEEFDAALARISRASLPDVGQPGRAFQQLAKE